MFPSDPKTPQVNPEVSGHRELPAVDSFQPSNRDVPIAPMAMPKPPKNHAPLIPIIIALLVAFVLIAAATIVYISTRKAPVPEIKSPSVSEVEKGKVSPEDIDATNKSIDQNLNNTNDSTDFKTEDLMDSTLGL